MANENTDDVRETLEALLVDNQDLARLEVLLNEFNVFEAIGAARQELRHSDFLRFLLDPSENHGLGDYFLKTLFKKALVGSSSQGLSAIDIDVANLSDAIVERERFQIDVLVHSEHDSLVLAIENKVDSLEHDGQLGRYAETVEREFRTYRKALIYLTPDGDTPSDPERWLPMSYGTLMDAVRSALEARRKVLAPAVITTLEHYATLIGRHIVADSEIARLCQQIYRKHKDAIDLIVEHKPDLQMDLKAVLEQEIQSHPDFVLDHCTKSRVRFLHRSWDSDTREALGSGWTPTHRVVLFELANDPESLKLKLYVGPVDKNDAVAIAFREAVFALSQKYRSDFPGGMGTLAPRFTSIMSRELVKRKEYADDPAGVPDKARAALKHAMEHEVPRAVERLREIVGEPQTQDIMQAK